MLIFYFCDAYIFSFILIYRAPTTMRGHDYFGPMLCKYYWKINTHTNYNKMASNKIHNPCIFYTYSKKYLKNCYSNLFVFKPVWVRTNIYGLIVVWICLYKSNTHSLSFFFFDRKSNIYLIRFISYIFCSICSTTMDQYRSRVLPLISRSNKIGGFRVI